MGLSNQRVHTSSVDVTNNTNSQLMVGHPSFLQIHNNYKNAIQAKQPHFPNSDYYQHIKAKYVERK